MEKKKNEKMGIGAVKGKDLTLDKNEAKKLNPRPEDMRPSEHKIGLAAQVADSTTYCRNWKFKNSDKHFPHEPLMRRVDKYFSYAKGGPLMVDEPTNKLEIAECTRKAVALRKEGHRYCFITKDMTLAEALAQLDPPRKASA